MKLTAEQTRVYEIVEKGLLGNGISREETEFLYGIDPLSQEASYVMWAGGQLARRASNNMAETHAQIGLDGSPCSKNCQFCSFAVINGVRHGRLEMPKEDVLEYAKVYVESGANLLLLLTTATYKFEKLLEMASAVREVIDPEMPLLVNTGDMSLEQCKQLKAAGVDGCYHAVRMGEGVVTTIPVERRLETLKNIEAAGLSLQTCVEPIGPEHTPAELTEKTFYCIESHPTSGGCGRRISVPGTLIYENGQLNNVYNALYVAVYWMASGISPKLNCSGHSNLTAYAGANIAWTEMGANPRDTEQRTEKGGHSVTTAFANKVFRDAGWDINPNYSQGWRK